MLVLVKDLAPRGVAGRWERRQQRPVPAAIQDEPCRQRLDDEGEISVPAPKRQRGYGSSASEPPGEAEANGVGALDRPDTERMRLLPSQTDSRPSRTHLYAAVRHEGGRRGRRRACGAHEWAAPTSSSRESQWSQSQHAASLRRRRIV